MLRVVVFDSGIGGELFGDLLKESLPVIEVIKVIDWRNADKYLKSSRTARKYAKRALAPYLKQPQHPSPTHRRVDPTKRAKATQPSLKFSGTSPKPTSAFGAKFADSPAPTAPPDLIIFANHFLTATSLKYFKRKYKHQSFTGFKLKLPDTFRPRPTVIMTTDNLSRTINYHNYIMKLRRPVTTLCLDKWLPLIDDGELQNDAIRLALDQFLATATFNNSSAAAPTAPPNPPEIILLNSHLNDIKPTLKTTYGHNLKIYDSFSDCYHDLCHLLKIRGGMKKQKH